MSCEAYSSEKVGMAMKGLMKLRRKKWQEVEIGYMSCEAYSSEKVGMAMKGLIKLRRKKWQEVEIKKARKLTFRNDCMKL